MIPKYTIQQLLWAMVGLALLALCISSAARGNHIAYGVSVAIFASVVPLLVFAVVHWVAFSIASLMGLISGRPTNGQTAVADVSAQNPADLEAGPAVVATVSDADARLESESGGDNA